MIFIWLFAIFAFASSQTENKSSCQQLKNAYLALCPNADGDIYIPRTVDKDIIERVLVQEVNAAMTDLAWLYSRLSETLEEQEKRIKQLEETTEYFPMLYKGKRYWIESRSAGINCSEAKKICEERGGKAADIVSREHHYLIMDHLRILSTGTGTTSAWIGMMYNSQNRTVLLSDGSPAPYVLWGPSRSRDICCCMALFARPYRKSLDQNMHSYQDDLTRKGVVCEK